MNFIKEMFNGLKLYPKLNNMYINLSMCIDMRESYSYLFNENDYDAFINKIKNDREYRKEIIEKLNNRFNLKKFILITNSKYDIWYFCEIAEDIKKTYTLLYVENIGKLNSYTPFNNYIDLFGNEIVFGK